MATAATATATDTSKSSARRSGRRHVRRVRGYAAINAVERPIQAAPPGAQVQGRRSSFVQVPRIVWTAVQHATEQGACNACMPFVMCTVRARRSTGFTIDCMRPKTLRRKRLVHQSVFHWRRLAPEAVPRIDEVPCEVQDVGPQRKS